MEDRGQQMSSYEALGQVMVSQCPGSFDHAVLRAELDEGFADLILTCVMQDGHNVEIDIRGIVMADIHEYLDNIREEMAQQSGSRWTHCTFTVQSDGRFNLDVGYEPAA